MIDRDIKSSGVSEEEAENRVKWKLNNIERPTQNIWKEREREEDIHIKTY